MKQIFLLFAVIVINHSVAIQTYAKTVEQENLKFNVQAKELLKGDIHYSFKFLTPRQLVEKYPEAIDLDSLSLIYEKNIRVLLTKTTYVVKKPVGFFSTDEVKEDAFIKHLMGPQKIKMLAQDTFKVTVQDDDFSYEMKIFSDSDDITTLNNSKVVQAVASMKKMDVISQGGSAFILKEFTKFTKHIQGSVSVTSYIPLQENSTLVITYQLTTIKKNLAQEKALKKNFIEETQAQKDLIESFEVNRP